MLRQKKKTAFKVKCKTILEHRRQCAFRAGKFWVRINRALDLRPLAITRVKWDISLHVTFGHFLNGARRLNELILQQRN